MFGKILIVKLSDNCYILSQSEIVIEVELDFDKIEEDYSWDYILELVEFFIVWCNVVVVYEVVKI